MNDKLKQPLGNRSLNWRHIVWFLAVWLFVSVLFRGFSPVPSTHEIPYTDFKEKVGRGEVAQITIKGNQINGKLKSENIDNEQHQRFRIYRDVCRGGGLPGARHVQAS
jgi:ATP-dependent Zn protease